MEFISRVRKDVAKTEPKTYRINKGVYIGGGVAENNHACAYQISMKDWAGKIKKWIESYTL